MPSDEPLTQVTHLLELLVSDAPLAQLAPSQRGETAEPGLASGVRAPMAERKLRIRRPGTSGRLVALH